MAKPSIFSKDYEKKMKKRRIRIVVTIIVVCVVSILGILKINKKVKNLSEKNKVNINNNVNDNKNVETVKKNPVKDKNNDKKQNLKYTYTLSTGENLDINYEDKNGVKKFTNVTSSRKDLVYSINLSQTGIVIYDSKPQKIIYMDINGNAQDITKNDYVDSAGNVFSKEQQLSQNPNYIWCSSPKFIDDENVAYISYLPWFNKTTQYIWIVNIKNKEHIYVQSISGDNIKLDKVTDKGITIVVDGNTFFLKGDASVSE
ncbi:hypothetical protein CLOACE_11870 [Clostridium acetireducens DSM 10703]|uniref:Uncharacterized protein n=1 Tax=Clostridium acetireducens DSM 10703 TaxID=1121290 RepID=A0A1E8EZW6_9CLOT|nr:hypothetical protein [Clostridium acetireducens]OFI06266.1 hypothetical protein CLOACE_11870 [Clostridium acetireducens DSM 10703]